MKHKILLTLSFLLGVSLVNAIPLDATVKSVRFTNPTGGYYYDENNLINYHFDWANTAAIVMKDGIPDGGLDTYWDEKENNYQLNYNDSAKDGRSNHTWVLTSTDELLLMEFEHKYNWFTMDGTLVETENMKYWYEQSINYSDDLYGWQRWDGKWFNFTYKVFKYPVVMNSQFDNVITNGTNGVVKFSFEGLCDQLYSNCLWKLSKDKKTFTLSLISDDSMETKSVTFVNTCGTISGSDDYKLSESIYVTDPSIDCILITTNNIEFDFVEYDIWYSNETNLSNGIGVLISGESNTLTRSSVATGGFIANFDTNIKVTAQFNNIEELTLVTNRTNNLYIDHGVSAKGSWTTLTDVTSGTQNSARDILFKTTTYGHRGNDYDSSERFARTSGKVPSTKNYLNLYQEYNVISTYTNGNPAVARVTSTGTFGEIDETTNASGNFNERQWVGDRYFTRPNFVKVYANNVIVANSTSTGQSITSDYNPSGGNGKLNDPFSFYCWMWSNALNETLLMFVSNCVDASGRIFVNDILDEVYP